MRSSMLRQAAVVVAIAGLAPLSVIAATTTEAAPSHVVVVTIPEIVTGGSDALPDTLSAGHSYNATIKLMATAGTGGATVRITARGGTMSNCSKKVAEATLVTMSCALRVNSAATKVQVDVAAKGTGFNKRYVTFTHVAH